MTHKRVCVWGGVCVCVCVKTVFSSIHHNNTDLTDQWLSAHTHPS